ncbi:MAG TPA: hypothetical protein VKX28_11525 [Xanthobacteraceae bacterium]|nr:hypothetical protein [Xanthobacteraceae bacterium]
MRSFLVALAMLFSFATVAFAADPVGTYEVEGKNPNGSKYEGSVTVTKTGDTYHVVWDVGGTKFVGTGIGNKDFIAITYRTGDSTGLALYGQDGDNWAGVWTYAEGTKMGAEAWKRQ